MSIRSGLRYYEQHGDMSTAGRTKRRRAPGKTYRNGVSFGKICNRLPQHETAAPEA